MITVNLKECPICGCHARIRAKKKHGPYYVECSGCGLRCSYSADVRKLEREWNEYVPEPVPEPEPLDNQYVVPDVRCADCILRTYEECPMFHYEERLLPWGVEYVPVDRTTDDGFCHLGRDTW